MSALYTPAEIEAFAARQHCSVDLFKLRWIIVYNGTCFIHGANGYRPGVKHQLDLTMALKKHLAMVPSSKVSSAGIDWEVPMGSGSKEKTIERIITEHGTGASHHMLCTDIEHSYFDPRSETFYERVCKLRPLEPLFDPRIDQWLRHLGGDTPDTLLDWVATCPDLSRPTAAVYLHAGKDAGKTMFATGIAKLWSESPTPLASAMSTFNSSVIDCPLLFADEEVPKGVTSGQIREFTGSLSRSIRRKGVPEASQRGAIRLILAANNPDILKFDREDLILEDVEATAARILYFKCSPGAAELLRELGGFEGTRDWVNRDLIAKHALWLRQNREVAHGHRFLVEGGVDITHRNIAASGLTRGRVIEWIGKAMIEKWMEPNPGIRFGGGELYVNASFVQKTWEQLLNDNRPPSLKQIGGAFKPLTRRNPSEKRFAIGAQQDKRRADFYRIDPQYVYDSASTLQIGEEETFQALINRPMLLEDSGDSSPNIPSGETLPFDPFKAPTRGTSAFELLSSK